MWSVSFLNYQFVLFLCWMFRLSFELNRVKSWKRFGAFYWNLKSRFRPKYLLSDSSIFGINWFYKYILVSEISIRFCFRADFMLLFKMCLIFSLLSHCRFRCLSTIDLTRGYERLWDQTLLYIKNRFNFNQTSS